MTNIITLTIRTARKVNLEVVYLQLPCNQDLINLVKIPMTSRIVQFERCWLRIRNLLAFCRGFTIQMMI